MTIIEWKNFSKARDGFKKWCIDSLNSFGDVYYEPFSKTSVLPSNLKKSIKASIKDEISYVIETPLVYNHSLDFITQNNDIKLILVGDNPGKEEQKKDIQRYLVGQAGRIAEGFFKRYDELGIDFRKNVIILNKTILHTPKTLFLKTLIKSNKKIENFFLIDQVFQAKYALCLQNIFMCPLWIVGYSQLKESGIFKNYSSTIIGKKEDAIKYGIFLYQHFSMNCFIKDINSSYDDSLSMKENLEKLGINNRKKILGF